MNFRRKNIVFIPPIFGFTFINSLFFSLSPIFHCCIQSKITFMEEKMNKIKATHRTVLAYRFCDVCASDEILVCYVCMCIRKHGRARSHLLMFLSYIIIPWWAINDVFVCTLEREFEQFLFMFRCVSCLCYYNCTVSFVLLLFIFDIYPSIGRNTYFFS